MTLETQLNDLMDSLLDCKADHLIDTGKIINCIDLTLLDEHASIEVLDRLNQDAIHHQVAAVCVHLQHVQHYSLAENKIGLATVINFPHGTDSLDISLARIEQAALSGATEIDCVVPYPMYLNGHSKQALDYCTTIGRLCKQQQLILKIILESSTFPDMQTIYKISRELIDTGCDFLKTSTGKIPQGASFSAAYAILSAIKDADSPCGFKVSGGVRTSRQANQYARLAESIMGSEINKDWFRIGASTLLHELSLHR